MYTAAGHVLTINGANKTAFVRMDGLDLAVVTEEDGRRRLTDDKWAKAKAKGQVTAFTNPVTTTDALENGAFCAFDSDCRSDRCDNFLSCSDKLDQGSWCGNDGDCRSNNCYFFKCT